MQSTCISKPGYLGAVSPILDIKIDIVLTADIDWPNGVVICGGFNPDCV
jgi:hypothetical protein